MTRLKQYVHAIWMRMICQSAMWGGASLALYVAISCACLAHAAHPKVSHDLKPSATGDVDVIVQYKQVPTEEHHKKVSFQDKYRLFLRKYEIPFDERHVWD